LIANQVWAKEEWNTGMMGLGRKKLNMIFLRFKPTIPSFHHSIIPKGWQKLSAPKNS